MINTFNIMIDIIDITDATYQANVACMNAKYIQQQDAMDKYIQLKIMKRQSYKFDPKCINKNKKL